MLLCSLHILKESIHSNSFRRYFHLLELPSTDHGEVRLRILAADQSLPPCAALRTPAAARASKKRQDRAFLAGMESTTSSAGPATGVNSLDETVAGDPRLRGEDLAALRAHLIHCSD
ncbi:hypothetical protein ZWY2020_013194 [Hordeum vulgare]|nr:hypothetical protein ZWY2020_013194 [Hordeum vulgare]